MKGKSAQKKREHRGWGANSWNDDKSEKSQREKQSYKQWGEPEWNREANKSRERESDKAPWRFLRRHNDLIKDEEVIAVKQTRGGMLLRLVSQQEGKLVTLNQPSEMALIMKKLQTLESRIAESVSKQQQAEEEA